MCKFKSGIILKNRVVLAPEGNDSHSDLLESLGIEDTHFNASKTFVRAELVPPDGNKAVDIGKWEYIVDQDITPDWYDDDPGRYEADFRVAVKEYLKDKFVVMCGRAWTPIKSDEKGTYYLLDGFLEESTFGKNNNYAESNIRNELVDSELAKDLRKEFGDRLVPIALDLLSLDGLDDYGIVEGDILAIPTLDLYRECRKSIPKSDSWWWLATPDSTPSGTGASYVQCVDSDGCVVYGGCGWNDWGVRPFCIIKSSIFVSEKTSGRQVH